MSITLAAAAQLAGIDKSTLRRAVKAGKLSATRDEHGVWRIEASEVERLYPMSVPEEARPAASPEALPRHAPADAAADVLVAELRQMLADVRADRDHWRSAFEAQQRLLPPPATGDAAPSNRVATVWRWLRKAG